MEYLEVHRLRLYILYLVYLIQYKKSWSRNWRYLFQTEYYTLNEEK
jgi:hypothetical protein